jgi:hypothetical protein
VFQPFYASSTFSSYNSRQDIKIELGIGIMNRIEACNLLHISPNQLNEKLLKQMYRRACLRHHPDKKGDAEQFIKINTAYEYLMNDINCVDTEESWMDELDASVLRKYVSILEKLNIPWIETYILFPLKTHLAEYKTIELNPTLGQLFNKELYYLESVHAYIPLWHQEVIIKKTTVLIKPVLPSNVVLDENNNVIVHLCCYQPNITLGGISFSIQKKQKMVFKQKGIPCINKKIYDVSVLSNVIVFISSQPSS